MKKLLRRREVSRFFFFFFSANGFEDFEDPTQNPFHKPVKMQCSLSWRAVISVITELTVVAVYQEPVNSTYLVGNFCINTGESGVIPQFQK